MLCHEQVFLLPQVVNFTNCKSPPAYDRLTPVWKSLELFWQSLLGVALMFGIAITSFHCLIWHWTMESMFVVIITKTESYPNIQIAGGILTPTGACNFQLFVTIYHVTLCLRCWRLARWNSWLIVISVICLSLAEYNVSSVFTQVVLGQQDWNVLKLYHVTLDLFRLFGSTTLSFNFEDSQSPTQYYYFLTGTITSIALVLSQKFASSLVATSLWSMFAAQPHVASSFAFIWGLYRS